MCGVVGCGGVGFRAVVCGGVMFGAVGRGAVPPRPRKAPSNLCLSPATCNPPTPLKPPSGSLPPPRVPEMVRPNKYTYPAVCVVVCYALFFTLIFVSLWLIFEININPRVD